MPIQPPSSQDPVKKKKKRPLPQAVLQAELRKQNVVRQGPAPTPTVLILQTKHHGSGCNSGLCVRQPFPAWPRRGCLFCLFLEAVALMDSAGDADPMGFLGDGSAFSPLPGDRWAPSTLLSFRRGKHQPSLCLFELVSPVVTQSVGEGWVCELGGGSMESPGKFGFALSPTGCPPFSSPTSRPIWGPLPNHRLIHSPKQIFSVCSGNCLPWPPPVQERGEKAPFNMLGQKKREFSHQIKEGDRC